MCVIFVKPQGVGFPQEQIMKNCWDNNPDMGGFMYSHKGKVIIRKGFMKFEDFKEALTKARKETGDATPYVCHFRISTQGYSADCCQPFPLTSKLGNMKKLRNSCNIGVAHNGVLSLTSDGSIEYSDTMKFIKDYLVNIIQSSVWYKNKRTVQLIENLIEGSRLAFLDATGHFEVLGQGWVKDKEILYSNTSYSRVKPVYAYDNDWAKGTSKSLYSYDDEYLLSKAWHGSWREKPSTSISKAPVFTDILKHDDYDIFWNPKLKAYEFPKYSCPFDVDGDDRYCLDCAKYGKCTWTFYQSKASKEEYIEL